MSRFYRASEDDLDQFLELGYVLVPGLFSRPEVEGLSRFARADQQLKLQATSRSDAKGERQRCRSIMIWTMESTHRSFAVEELSTICRDFLEMRFIIITIR